MKIFSNNFLADLTGKARTSERLRQHCNVHQSYKDPCQKLFNAIEPESYIRPHRHAAVSGDELLIAVRGLMALITFNHHGNVIKISRFGTEKNGCDLAVGCEVPSGLWHTVVALEVGSVLLEVKSGPFNPKDAKEHASWAPSETSEKASRYLQSLIDKCR